MKVLFLSDFVPQKKLLLNDKVVSIIDKVDIVVFNLEGTYTISNRKLPLMPFYKDDLLSFVNRFTTTKFIIALANNHILDNGNGAFDSLVNLLEESNIDYLGTKLKPYIILDNLAILNFVSAETLVDATAQHKLNYLFLNENTINSQIKHLEERVSGPLIFYPHWGRDMDKKILKTYTFTMDKNRWIILGHHPHIITGITNNNIYSMGNTFIPHPYYYKQYPATRYGLAVLLDTATHTTHFFLTNILSVNNYNENFSLDINVFEKLPEELGNHAENFSIIKRLYLNIFEFSGNKLMDFIRLKTLRFIQILLRAKLYLKLK